jgi:hypothetical protein
MEARLAIRHPTRSVTVPTAPQLLGAHSNQQLAWFSAFSTALFSSWEPVSFIAGQRASSPSQTQVRRQPLSGHIERRSLPTASPPRTRWRRAGPVGRMRALRPAAQGDPSGSVPAARCQLGQHQQRYRKKIIAGPALRGRLGGLHGRAGVVRQVACIGVTSARSRE